MKRKEQYTAPLAEAVAATALPVLYTTSIGEGDEGGEGSEYEVESKDDRFGSDYITLRNLWED